MRYKMLGDIEQGIHYTSFMEDVEDENASNKKEIGKSHGETTIEKLDIEQSIFSNIGSIF